jgi:hypothetical protein
MSSSRQWKVVNGGQELHLGPRRYASVTQKETGGYELKLLVSEVTIEPAMFDSLEDAKRQAEEWADLEGTPTRKTEASGRTER